MYFGREKLETAATVIAATVTFLSVIVFVVGAVAISIDMAGTPASDTTNSFSKQLTNTRM